MSPTSDGTFAKPNGKSTRALPTRLVRTFYLRNLPKLMRPTKTSATSSTQRKNRFHAVVGKTTDHAGMRSARPSIRHFFGHRRVKALTQLPCLIARLDKRRRKRWSEAVNAIDYTHSSRLAWNAINNLTGRTRQSYRSCPCPFLPTQLLRNWLRMGHISSGNSSTKKVGGRHFGPKIDRGGVTENCV